jgi:hypothetical protein
MPPEPADRRGPQAAGRDYAGAFGEGVGPVPGEREGDRQASHGPDNGDDDDDDVLTSPLPAILPGATALPRPGPVEAPRGPFEPARPNQPAGRPPSITGSVEPPPVTFSAPHPIPVPPLGPSLRPAPATPSEPSVPPRLMPEAAAAKLDQIKDLYLTAEAIGEDALDRHFDQVSQRQRELIREFFDRSKPSSEDAQS